MNIKKIMMVIGAGLVSAGSALAAAAKVGTGTSIVNLFNNQWFLLLFPTFLGGVISTIRNLFFPPQQPTIPVYVWFILGIVIVFILVKLMKGNQQPQYIRY